MLVESLRDKFDGGEQVKVDAARVWEDRWCDVKIDVDVRGLLTAKIRSYVLVHRISRGGDRKAPVLTT